MAEPFRSSFGTFGSFGGSSSGGFFSPAETLTPLQQLQLDFLKNKYEKEEGILGKIFGAVGGGVKDFLQFITRPSYAIAEGTRAGLEGKGFDISDALHGAARGIKGEAHTGFGQVLEQEGFLKGHRRARGFLGLIGDIATDPLMLAAIGAAPITGGASLSLIAARAAEKGIAKPLLLKASETAVRATETTSHRQLKQAERVLAQAGEGFEAQRALASLRLGLLDRGKAWKQKLTDKERAEVAALEDSARRERISALGGNYLNLQYKIPFGPRLTSPNLPIRTPSLARFADREIPVASSIAGHIADAVKPGWDEPKFAAIRSVGRRVAQEVGDTNIKTFRQLLGPYMFGRDKMDMDEVFSALHFGEVTEGIVKQGRVGPKREFKRIINRRMLDTAVKGGALTERQSGFLRAWHDYMEVLRKQDIEWGHVYDKPLGNVVYVPHLYARGGGQIIGAPNARNILSKPGYEYERLSRNPHSVEQLHELFTKGIYKKELETNPYRLAIIRGRRGAQAHSEKVMRDVVAAAYGVATKIPDADKLNKARVALQKNSQKLQSLKFFSDPKHEGKLKLQAEDRTNKIVQDRLNKASKALQAKVRYHQENIEILKQELAVAERRVKRHKKPIKKKDLEGLAKLVGKKPPKTPGQIRAQIKRQERAIKTAGVTYEHALQKTLAHRDKALQKTDSAIDDMKLKEINEAERLAKRIQKEEDRLVFHQTSATNPAALDPRMVTPDGRQLLDANGKPMAIPREIEGSLKKIEEAIQSDRFLREFSNVWDKNVGRWKIAATVVNPGYRVRNTITDMWNMFVRGVPLWAINKYGMVAAREMYKALKNGDPRALAEFKEAFNHGIFSGLFQGDVDRVLRSLQYTRPSVRSPRVLRGYTRFMMQFNRNAENWGRYTHYLYARRHLKMGPSEAAARVKETHFDYEDLTSAERFVKRNLAPFYTWTRKNVPFQITSMLARPGRYSTFQKLMNEAEYAAGPEPENFSTPDWLENALAFRVPFGDEGTMAIPQFGPSDLEKIGNPKSLAGLLNPFLKMPIELLTNQSTFTGAPIHGNELTHPLSPVSKAGQLLAFGLRVPTGTTARKVRGKVMRGPGADPLFSYLAGQIPPVNFMVNQLSNIRREQRGGVSAPLLSYLGGISTYNPDPAQTELSQEQEFNKSFRQYLRGLRDQGKYPEVEEREESPFQQQLNTLLKDQAKIF